MAKAKKTNDLENLERLLEELYLDEASIRIVSSLVEKGKVPKKYVNEAIDVLEKAGKYEAAARIAEEAGLTERARELYIMAVHSDRPTPEEVGQKRGDSASVEILLERLAAFRQSHHIRLTLPEVLSLIYTVRGRKTQC